MKRINVLKVAVFLVLALFAAQSFAQETEGNKSESLSALQQGPVRVSLMMDKTVKDQAGDDLGQIEDVYFDQQGRSIYGILAGPDNKYYPIPLQTLTQSIREDNFVLNMDKARINNAPSFPRDEWPAQLSGSEWEQKVFSYYGAQPPSETTTQPGSERMTQPGGEQPKDQPTTGQPADDQPKADQPTTGTTEPKGQ